MTFICTTMKVDNYGYYKIRKNHDELFEDYCSFHELLYYAEAPIDITQVNIWRYVEHIPIKELLGCHKNSKLESFLLTKEQTRQYPYFELFCSIKKNHMKFPLIFEILDGDYVCLEGKHRFHILLIMYFQGEDIKVPCIIVEKMEERKELRYPEGFSDWLDWLKEKSFVNHYKRRKKEFDEKFLRTK